MCVYAAPSDHHFHQLALVRHHAFRVINLLVSLILDGFTLPSLFSLCILTSGLKIIVGKAFIQMQGFLLMFMLYSIIGLFWTSLSNNQSLLLVLYSGTFLFANYGPNTTTFLLPSVTYSEDCRSTLNGMSAAAGKLGALVGASLFAPAADMWGVNIVMICCACVSLVACGLTKICLG